MRAKDLRDWTSWAGSSHAANDETGVLMTPAHGFVPYDRAAWTLRNGNAISENIEQCGFAKWTRAEWLARPKLLETTALWLADRARARGIPLVRLSDDDIRARRPGVIGHGDYSRATKDGTHWDPGPGYPWDVVLAKARWLLNPTPTAPAAKPAPVPEDDMPLTQADVNWIADTIANRELGRFPNGTKLHVWQAWLNSSSAAGALQEVAGLRAVVDKLTTALAAQQDVDIDELRDAIREEMAKVVEVRVTVAPTT